MGGLIALLSGEKKMTIDIFLDFEAAAPQTDKEKEIHSQIADILSKAEQILDKLNSYKGCDELIRSAISKPTPESEKAAWEAILPSVDILQEFFVFSVEIDKIYPRLLTSLFQSDDDLKKKFGRTAVAC